MLGGLAPVLASLLAVDMGAFTRRMRRNAVLYAIAGLFLLTAYVAGVAALAVYMATMMHPAAAVGIVALAAFVVAMIFLAVISICNRAEEKRRRKAAAANSGKAMMLTAAMSALPLVIRSKPLAAVAVAGGLAVVLGRVLGGSSSSDEV